MDVDDSFYDELSSFMSSPSGYDINHHDFDDIISSTVSHLDSSLDLNTFLPQDRGTSLNNDNLFSDLFQSTTDSHNDLELNFDNLSTTTTQSWNVDRTSLGSSIDASSNLINICEDNAEIEKLTSGNLLEHIQDRDTPSPTDSCGSFSGSSTSGVHSDTSDAWQNRQQEQSHMAPASFNVSQFPVPFAQSFTNRNEDSIQKSLQKPQFAASVVNNQEIIGKSVNNSAVVLQTTLEVKSAPIVTGLIPVNVNASLPAKSQKPTREKIIAEAATENVGKTKTIFLSTNDYKALMDKINLNGSKGAKINGSVKTHIPKIVMKTGNPKIKGHQNVDASTCPTLTQSPSNIVKNQSQLPHSNLKREISMESESSNFHFRNTIDEKMFKKQQRMIKNRQSASMSRKKKKEYVVSLETRLHNLEKENSTLKGENLSLRNQLVALAKTCKCRKGSVCEFVLHSLNSNARTDQHVKIAPRPTTKSFKQHMNAATVKKNIAVLFAMAFMVTLNAGNFQSYLSKQNLEAENTAAVTSDSNVVNEPVPIGRRLLWVDTEEEYNEKLNQSNRPAEAIAPPPLHFLRPISRGPNVTKNDHWNATQPSRFNRANDPPPLTYPSSAKCNGSCANSSVNQSEYSRLALNLEKLINTSGYHKLGMNSKYNIDRDNAHGFKFSTDYLELPDMARETATLGKRKSFLGFKETIPDIEQKQRKIDLSSKNTLNTSEPIHLFKAIKRQEDTFYVLSLNTDHILLSPSTYNKSSRPKMSLLLPTGEPSPNGDIMMMQVDCEIFNTKEVELKSHMIPASLRPNITKWQIKAKPTSMNANSNNRTLGSSKFLDRSIKHEKPRVRTYFMVGPKNQAAAAASQEKPRLVELNKSMVNNNSKVLTVDFDSRLND
ncbi:PREDICTED: uncharacterized protein LOC108615491 [Drosophila arizonae]|uniref:Uncharacterized protein LOC108615491 n=1 Tax=Drosophila arizonae TaxID=7263 RepID=A0ABM1PE56_DROAR|nr:PREDICTED: uncharacterized protein LOC108615491 [Drosophila arizonae]XP_017865493.1 PREDICTED: uncharacterized protein LOC108615491 [Drosophila arizonae]